MATEAQIAANRENAKKSTGPKTDAGKLRSARNALKHGFRANIILDYVAVLEQERPDSFASLLLDVVALLQPDGPLEEFCVETVAVCMWRLRRVVGEEDNLVDELHDELEAEADSRAFYRDPGVPDPKPIIYPFLPKGEFLLPLMRYEAHLNRQRKDALRELRELQAMRLASTPASGQAPLLPASTGSSLPNEASVSATGALPSAPSGPADNAPSPAPLGRANSSPPAAHFSHNPNPALCKIPATVTPFPPAAHPATPIFSHPSSPSGGSARSSLLPNEANPACALSEPSCRLSRVQQLASAGSASSRVIDSALSRAFIPSRCARFLPNEPNARWPFPSLPGRSPE